MTSAPAIGFEYRPSRLFPQLLLVTASLAWVAVLLCALSWWLKAILLLGTGLLVARNLRRLAVSSVAAAGWGGEGGWSLRLDDRSDIPAALASFRVFGSCVLLRLRTAKHGMQVLLLAPDNSDADIRRRLRMRLAIIRADEAAPRL